MSDNTPFFVGYLPVPHALRTFLVPVGVLLVLGLALVGYMMGTAQDDPGNAGPFGRQTVKGVIELTPYPLLHVTEGNQRIQPGQTFLMSAGGKAGVGDRAQPLVGQLARASGVILERGALSMLQLRGGRNGLQAADGDATAPAPISHGRWKLAGEICDGKCLAGAMRPGRGLAHKACANLCLIGEVPPVFVSTGPVLGQEFLLITGPDNTFLPDAAYDFIAQYVTVEGEITQHGDLLRFAIDPATLELTR